MTGEWCLCTLALGDPYRSFARQLALDIARFAPGVPFFVLSDDPSRFEGLANVKVVYHRKRSVLGYNDKLCVIHKVLKKYRTVVFIDADARLQWSHKSFRHLHGRREIDPDEINTLGLFAGCIRPHHRAESGWERNSLRIMGLLRDRFDLPDNGRQVPYAVESLFAVTKGAGPSTEAFMQKWSDLAEFCERKKFFIHGGYSIGLAANLTSFPIEQHGFLGKDSISIFLLRCQRVRAQERSLLGGRLPRR